MDSVCMRLIVALQWVKTNGPSEWTGGNPFCRERSKRVRTLPPFLGALPQKFPAKIWLLALGIPFTQVKPC